MLQTKIDVLAGRGLMQLSVNKATSFILDFLTKERLDILFAEVYKKAETPGHRDLEKERADFFTTILSILPQHQQGAYFRYMVAAELREHIKILPIDTIAKQIFPEKSSFPFSPKKIILAFGSANETDREKLKAVATDDLDKDFTPYALPKVSSGAFNPNTGLEDLNKQTLLQKIYDINPYIVVFIKKYHEGCKKNASQTQILLGQISAALGFTGEAKELDDRTTDQFITTLFTSVLTALPRQTLAPAGFVPLKAAFQVIAGLGEDILATEKENIRIQILQALRRLESANFLCELVIDACPKPAVKPLLRQRLLAGISREPLFAEAPITAIIQIEKQAVPESDTSSAAVIDTISACIQAIETNPRLSAEQKQKVIIAYIDQLKTESRNSRFVIALLETISIIYANADGKTIAAHAMPKQYLIAKIREDSHNIFLNTLLVLTKVGSAQDNDGINDFTFFSVLISVLEKTPGLLKTLPQSVVRLKSQLNVRLEPLSEEFKELQRVSSRVYHGIPFIEDKRASTSKDAPQIKSPESLSIFLSVLYAFLQSTSAADKITYVQLYDFGYEKLINDGVNPVVLEQINLFFITKGVASAQENRGVIHKEQALLALNSQAIDQKALHIIFDTNAALQLYDTAGKVQQGDDDKQHKRHSSDDSGIAPSPPPPRRLDSSDDDSDRSTDSGSSRNSVYETTEYRYPLHFKAQWLLNFLQTSLPSHPTHPLVALLREKKLSEVNSNDSSRKAIAILRTFSDNIQQIKDEHCKTVVRLIKGLANALGNHEIENTEMVKIFGKILASLATSQERFPEIEAYVLQLKYAANTDGFVLPYASLEQSLIKELSDQFAPLLNQLLNTANFEKAETMGLLEQIMTAQIYYKEIEKLSVPSTEFEKNLPKFLKCMAPVKGIFSLFQSHNIPVNILHTIFSKYHQLLTFTDDLHSLNSQIDIAKKLSISLSFLPEKDIDTTNIKGTIRAAQQAINAYQLIHGGAANTIDKYLGITVFSVFQSGNSTSELVRSFSAIAQSCVALEEHRQDLKTKNASPLQTLKKSAHIEGATAEVTIPREIKTESIRQLQQELSDLQKVYDSFETNEVERLEGHQPFTADEVKAYLLDKTVDLHDRKTRLAKIKAVHAAYITLNGYCHADADALEKKRPTLLTVENVAGFEDKIKQANKVYDVRIKKMEEFRRSLPFFSNAIEASFKGLNVAARDELLAELKKTLEIYTELAAFCKDEPLEIEIPKFFTTETLAAWNKSVLTKCLSDYKKHNEAVDKAIATNTSSLPEALQIFIRKQLELQPLAARSKLFSPETTVGLINELIDKAEKINNYVNSCDLDPFLTSPVDETMELDKWNAAATERLAKYQEVHVFFQKYDIKKPELKRVSLETLQAKKAECEEIIASIEQQQDDKLSITAPQDLTLDGLIQKLKATQGEVRQLKQEVQAVINYRHCPLSDTQKKWLLQVAQGQIKLMPTAAKWAEDVLPLLKAINQTVVRLLNEFPGISQADSETAFSTIGITLSTDKDCSVETLKKYQVSLSELENLYIASKKTINDAYNNAIVDHRIERDEDIEWLLHVKNKFLKTCEDQPLAKRQVIATKFEALAKIAGKASQKGSKKEFAFLYEDKVKPEEKVQTFLAEKKSEHLMALTPITNIEWANYAKYLVHRAYERHALERPGMADSEDLYPKLNTAIDAAAQSDNAKSAIEQAIRTYIKASKATYFFPRKRLGHLTVALNTFSSARLPVKVAETATNETFTAAQLEEEKGDALRLIRLAQKTYLTTFRSRYFGRGEHEYARHAYVDTLRTSVEGATAALKEVNGKSVRVSSIYAAFDTAIEGIETAHKENNLKAKMGITKSRLAEELKHAKAEFCRLHGEEPKKKVGLFSRWTVRG